MANKKWKGKKMIAAGLGGGVLLVAVALTQDPDLKNVLAAGDPKETLSLAIAGEEEQENETAAEEKNQTKVGLSLADPGTGDEAVTAAEETAKETQEAAASEEETAAEEETAEEQKEETEETQEETAKEEEKKEAVSYETLETTVTGEEGIVALDVSGIVENTMPSIVSITNKSIQEVQSYLYGRQEIETEGAGSGIIIAQNEDELLIATNQHVVENSSEMTVCFSVDAEDPDELVVPAVTKGTDKTHDLAVVAVKLEDIPSDVLSQLKIATLGSSEDLKVGETAIAIGNALGIGQTVTSGIISALEREITTDAGTFTELQTDAAINFGCSGGALLNKRGEVIGINSAKATADYAESMGYAIPIDTAIPILTDLINRETRDVVDNHGVMGITVVPVSDEAMEMYNMPAGAFVYEVTEGGAGEAAGLKKGDIITRFDGIAIDSSDTLVDTLSYYAAGETVTIEIQQAADGAYVSKELEVTLQENPNPVSEDADEEDAAAPDEGEGLEEVPEFQGVPSPDELYGYEDGMNGQGDIYDFFFGGENGYF